MKIKLPSSHIGDLLTLSVFTLFAACTLLLMLYGSQLYQNMQQNSSTDYEARTAARYISTRLHQADTATSPYLSDFAATQALVLPQSIDGITYETRLYCYNGYLCELFAAADAALQPQDGEALLPLASLSFCLQDDMLAATATDSSNKSMQIYVRLRSGRRYAHAE